MDKSDGGGGGAGAAHENLRHAAMAAAELPTAVRRAKRRYIARLHLSRPSAECF